MIVTNNVRDHAVDQTLMTVLSAPMSKTASSASLNVHSPSTRMTATALIVTTHAMAAKDPKIQSLMMVALIAIT